MAADSHQAPPGPGAAARKARPITLALQGGGSHGAFTWGVLDALLEDGRLALDAISGTSAGAMNAAVLACGWAAGGAQGARDALASFWAAVGGVSGCWGMLPKGDLPAWAYNRAQWPGFAAWEAWVSQWSPYELNPLNLDPLRRIVDAHVDLAALRGGPIKLFITATSVRTGQPRVFSGDSLSVDALLASACLPLTSQTVVIDGEPLWDGGFSGNPALWPLIYGADPEDLLIVQINPLQRDGIPRTMAEINDRLNEITFNASLVAELRAIAFVQRLLKDKQVDPRRYKDLRLHRIADEAGLAPFDASSKLNTDPRLLRQLCELGQQAARRWLEQELAHVGRSSSLDVAQVFLAERPGQPR